MADEEGFLQNLDYGIIGNGTSCALVSKGGSIDWCCLPHFDSASVFGKILDLEKGGCLSIDGPEDCEISQNYLPRTSILRTVYRKGRNAFEVLDFMPRHRLENGEVHCPPDVFRLLRPLAGKPRVRIRHNPRMNYGKANIHHEIRKDHIKSATLEGGTYESLYLYTNLDCRSLIDGHSMVLENDAYLVLSYNQKLTRPDIEHVELEMERTKVYWMSWVSRSHVFEEYRDEITRSALTLKMLSYERTGAILAAATTSLPESIGEERNWDYRFCWIRDASMTIRTLIRIGQQDTARKFVRFILGLIPYKDEEIQIMYGIHGQKKLTEKELGWLSGYENSGPVRIGNAAYRQKQNDIFGILLDAIEQSLSIFESDIASQEHIWTIVRTMVRHVTQRWKKPDMGIWELRTKKKHFTFSKVLCWVAMDRAVKIANLLGQHHVTLKWSTLRDQIKMDVLEKGWNEQAQAFTQAYGETALDASTLLMEPYGFIDPRDPRYVSTVRQTYEKLCVDGLTYRYLNEDDFGKPKSSFTICSFWMIRALHQIGEGTMARNLFDQLIGNANHLGLLSEDIDVTTRRLLGNFPQAYSHLALIDTALVLTGQEKSWQPHTEPTLSGFQPMI